MFLGEYICERKGERLLLPEAAGPFCDRKWVLLETADRIMFLRITGDTDGYSDSEELAANGLSLAGMGEVKWRSDGTLTLPEPFLRHLAEADGADSSRGGADLVLLGCGPWMEIWSRKELLLCGAGLGYE